MANARRISKSETKRKPKNVKRHRLSETKKRWKKRAADYWVATSIRQYVEHCGVIYSSTIDGLLIELSEVLDGQVQLSLLEKYRCAIEIGVEMRLFQVATDDASDPRCWGIWIPEAIKETRQTSYPPNLILATG